MSRVDFDECKSVFQVPRSWFAEIQDRVYNAYGVNFVQVNKGIQGGMEIGVDQ